MSIDQQRPSGVWISMLRTANPRRASVLAISIVVFVVAFMFVASVAGSGSARV
ncbi:MAG: hypothetical protein KF699_08805 [Phycisphaeraceae bacterium]|nr:hypothetical protein [Phycisphaeraceae bacterium]